MKFLALSFLLFFQLLYSPLVLADSVTSENKPNPPAQYENTLGQDESSQHSPTSEETIEKTDVEPLMGTISYLEGVVRDQNETIESLQETIVSLPGTQVTQEQHMTFEVWTGILLAVSALVLGAVGIGLAVFSFIGYKELINKGVEKSTSVATEISEKVAADTISERVENEVSSQIERLIIDGTFDNVINERVDQYIYRGIGSFSSETDNIEEQPEDGKDEIERG